MAFPTVLAKDVSDNLRFKYLGLGFLWAWIYATWMSPVLFPKATGMTVFNNISWLISSGMVAVTLLGLAPILRDKDIVSMRWMRIAGTVGTTLGSIMMACEPLFGLQLPAIAYIGAALTGVSSGFLWMLWGEFSGRVELEISELFLPFCVAVPIVVMLSTTFTSGPLAGFAVCLLPMISGILLEMCLADKSISHPATFLPQDEKPAYMPDFVRMGIGSFAIYTTISFIWAMADYLYPLNALGITHAVPYSLGAAAAIVITVSSILFSTKLNLFGLYRWLIPIILFALTLSAMGSLSGYYMTVALVTTAQFGFDIIVWVYCTRITRKGICRGSFAIGINRGSVQAGVFVGSVLALIAKSVMTSGQVTYPFVCLCIASLLVTSVLTVLNRTDNLEHASYSDTPKNQDIIPDIDKICSQVATKYSLTAREAEILSYPISHVDVRFPIFARSW